MARSCLMSFRILSYTIQSRVCCPVFVEVNTCLACACGYDRREDYGHCFASRCIITSNEQFFTNYIYLYMLMTIVFRDYNVDGTYRFYN